MRIKVNGREMEIDKKEISLRSLLHNLKIKEGIVAVELNRMVVRKGSYDEVTVKDGDEIEILQLVGGG